MVCRIYLEVQIVDLSQPEDIFAGAFPYFPTPPLWLSNYLTL